MKKIALIILYLPLFALADVVHKSKLGSTGITVSQRSNKGEAEIRVEVTQLVSGKLLATKEISAGEALGSHSGASIPNTRMGGSLQK